LVRLETAINTVMDDAEVDYPIGYHKGMHRVSWDAAEMRRALEAALSLPVQPVAWDGRVAKILSHDDYMQLVFEGYSIVHESRSTPPAPPTKGPEDDLIVALEKRAEWHKCSCPEPCDDYGVFPGGCAGRYREDYLSLLALRSRPASALPVVGEAGKLAPGCCSAISPCSHQRHDPRSICDTCRAALTPSVQP